MRFDATLRGLAEAHPLDWLDILGLAHAGQVSLLDTDLSAITAASDKLILSRDPRGDWVLHLEFLSRKDLTVPERINLYDAVVIRHHGVAIYSVVVVLCARADDPSLTGYYEKVPHHGHGGQTCRYGVWRPFRESPQQMLRGGIGTLCLAVLGNVPATELPEVIRQMETRIEAELSPAEGCDPRLWQSAGIRGVDRR
jgi:hypothetical protein